MQPIEKSTTLSELPTTENRLKKLEQQVAILQSDINALRALTRKSDVA